jgi:exosortase
MERPNPLLCFGLLLGLFAPLLWEWGGYVAQVARLSYALLVPFLALWLYWHARGHEEKLPRFFEAKADDPLPWLLLLGGGALFVIGGVSSVFTISVAGFPLAIMGVCGLLSGRPGLWRYRFALIMSLAMVPIPLPFLDRFTPLMVQASGDTAVAMLRIVESGEITWVGSNLNFRGWDIFVAEACSGSGTLLTLGVLSMLLAGLFSMRLWTLGLMLVLVGPLTLVVNGLRIALTAWILDVYGPAAVTGSGHEILGQVVVILAGAGFAVAVDRLTRPRSAKVAEKEAQA